MKITNIIIGASTMLLFLAGIARADDPALSPPVKSVYERYLKIQASLADDSMNDVAKNANAIVKAVHGNARALPAEVGSEAVDVAKATDLSSARDAFKPLSESLVHYLADRNAGKAYVQVYCPMANANWLQAGKNVKNPYLGKAMPGCGEIKN